MTVTTEKQETDLTNGHMLPQAIHGTMYVGETNEGTVILEEDIFEFESKHYGNVSWEKTSGWFARWSAPGYLDATEWMGPYDTEEEAIAALDDM